MADPFLPDGHVRLICRLWLPRGTGAVRSRDWCTARRILGMPSPPLSDSRSPRRQSHTACLATQGDTEPLHGLNNVAVAGLCGNFTHLRDLTPTMDG